MFYFSLYKNWGDLLGPFLVESYSERKVVKSYLGVRKHLLGVGSIIEQSNSKSIIWGSGFQNPTDRPLGAPFYVASVRGPLTRSRLVELGISCPKTYGDPALLLPRIYPRRTFAKQRRIGVILHRNHQKYRKLFDEESVVFIDISTTDITKFIDQVCSCEVILSSSLHGLIVSDAYGISNVWIGFEESVLPYFKFLDYYASLDEYDHNPIQLSFSTSFTLSQLVSRASLRSITSEKLDSVQNAFKKALEYF